MQTVQRFSFARPHLPHPNLHVHLSHDNDYREASQRRISNPSSPCGSSYVSSTADTFAAGLHS